MANSTGKQILEDGYRNAVVKLVGTLDTSDVSLVPAISLSDFLQNDRMMGKLVGLRVDKIDYSSGPNLVTTIEWQSGSPQPIVSFAQSEELDMTRYGGLNPDRTITGYNGAINLRTSGYAAGNKEAYTVVLRMAKVYAQTGV